MIVQMLPHSSSQAPRVCIDALLQREDVIQVERHLVLRDREREKVLPNVANYSEVLEESSN